MPTPSQPKHQGYFEAVIQLRPASKDLVRFVYESVKKKQAAWVAKEELLKTGTDIFISDRHLALAIGKQLKRQFKGALSLSRTIHTRDRETSKDVYRVTVLFRLAQA